MKVLAALAMATGLVLTAGCGGGDATAGPTGVLYVTRGGSGTVYFPTSQNSLSFDNSVTVAVQTANDSATQFTLYTLFGLTDLNYRQVPSAALVTFVDGLSPTGSSSTTLASTVVTMALHTGFNQNLVTTDNSGITTPLAQDATQVFESALSGAFVLEADPTNTGGFTPQGSTARRARYATVTLSDVDAGEEALLEGAVAFDLSKQINQDFFGYAGNLGLTTKPDVTGGGPPAPPGSNGSGGSGSSDDTPPASPY